VSAPAVQQALRERFEQWGLPARIRVDNGVPWGSGSDLPPPLTLWWVGLGIGVIWNHPHRPTENAKVERQNGTVQRWGEPAHCADFAAWEQKLAWAARVQREQYPAVQGQSRLAAYPALQQPARPYTAAQEGEQWELARVYAFLAQELWPRQVSTSRQISLYGQAYRVGKAQPGQPVWVRFDASTQEWVVQGGDGTALVRHRAEQLTTERICQLQVAKPHASSQKPRRRRNLLSPPAPKLYAA
jgi:hypothetical protein